MARPALLGSVVSVGLLSVACGVSVTTRPPPPRGRAIAPAVSHTATAAPVTAWIVPPLGIKTPAPGAPSAGELASSRLVAESCSRNKEVVAARIEAQIAAMRARVEASYQSWKEQPRCEERGITWDSFRGAGLGISGVGHGGGGGVGIGVGGSGHLVARATVRSDTNNQVAGVDEADIVKNDGAYVYVASNGALRIVEALRPRLVSVTKLPGEVREMLLEGDRAALFVAMGGGKRSRCTYGYDCRLAGDGSRTSLVVLDVKDRAQPRIARQMDLSGSLISARRIGRTVHVVVADGEEEVPTYETWPAIVPEDCKVKGADPEAVRARFEQLIRENEAKIRAASGGFPTITERGVSRQLCEAMHAQTRNGEAFTTLVSFDMSDDGRAPVTAVVQSRPGVVFASENALYFSVRSASRGAKDEESTIHKFSIGKDPAATRYVGSGTVPGHALNQFAMDEWYGYLRVATSRGRVPDPDAESAVTVLSEAEGGNLVRVGAIEHMARGEDIRSVRFDSDRAYVVTFKKTDPLFVIDLARPDRPSVLGELKIPGFSTYLHRIDPTHLLSIGFDANDHGSFAYFDGIILQLFDVTRPTEPRLLFKEKLGTRGSSSAAATDHLAFNYWGGRLAIPITQCEGGGDGAFGDKLTFSGLVVYDVSVEDGFRRRGGVSHGPAGASCQTWWSNATSKVKRSIFMDDLVFSIATDRLKVQRVDRLGEDVGDVPLGP